MEKPKVLIVEDSKTVVLLAEQILMRRGYRDIRSTAFGEEALAICESDPPQLILMDIMLAGEWDGITTAGKIIEKFHIPVIFMTAAVEDEFLERGAVISNYGYLIKPFSEFSLYAALRNAWIRFEMEQELIRQESRYQLLFSHRTGAFLYLRFYENKSDASFSFDAEIVEVNQHFLDIVGIDKGQLIHQSLLKIFPGLLRALPDWREIAIALLFDRKTIHKKIYLPNRREWLSGSFYSPDGVHVAGILEDITEKQNMENDLRQSEMKFRSLVRSAQDAIFMMDEECILSLWNPAAEYIFSISEENAIGQSVYRMISPPELVADYKKFFNEWLQESKGRTTNRTLELRAVTGKHDQIYIEISLSAVMLDGNWQAICIVRDISKRKMTEKLLQDKEERYRTLMDSIPSGVVIVDAESMLVVDCNQAALGLLRYTKEEILGTSCQDIFCTVGEASCSHLCNRIKEGEIAQRELEIKKQERGVHITLVKNVVSIRIQNHLFFIESFMDISEQKSSERKIQQAHDEIQSLLSSIDSIIIGISREEEVTHWNHIAENTFGLKAEDVIGKKFFSIGMNWAWPDVFEGMCESYSTLSATHIDTLSYQDRSGAEILLAVTINPIMDDKKNIRGCLLYAKDITKKRVMEMQLIQDQKLKSIGELSAGISHEINTPTQYIMENTRFLQEAFEKLAEVYRRYQRLESQFQQKQDLSESFQEISQIISGMDLPYLVEEIPVTFRQTMQGLEHVARIVKSMKSFARPDQEEKVPVIINSLVEDAVFLAKNEWKYDAEVQLELGAGLPAMEGFPAEISQVLINILVNAAHAIQEARNKDPERKGKINISTRLLTDSIEIRIVDNGTGIPEKIQNRIYDPFFTTKGVGKGTGQGLSIARFIVVEKHGGSLLFETKEGEGTVFIIRFFMDPK